jgi:2-oxoglutarate ferredoxin oxidoreductase subunit beta
VQDPNEVLILAHEDGVQLSPGLAGVYRNQAAHDPGDLIKAREIAGTSEKIPVGILYRNEDVPCYEDLCKPEQLYTPGMIRSGLEEELDRFTIWPAD